MARPVVKAKTLTSAPGSRRGSADAAARGFTLIELLLVLLLIAMVSGLASLALRDGGQARLEREALRLAALLEAGRAEARASGVAVRFELIGSNPGSTPLAAPPGIDPATLAFRFVGLPPDLLPPGAWLEREVHGRIVGASALRLGPEPLIGEQRIVLSLGDRQVVLATDGLGPFQVQEPPQDGAGSVGASTANPGAVR